MSHCKKRPLGVAKRSLGALSLACSLAVLSLAAPASGNPGSSCSTCQAMGSAPTAGALPLSGPANQNDLLGINVAAIVNHPKTLVPMPQQAPIPGFVKNWDGVGDLPNAFHAPWSLSYDSDFDPTFRVPFWSETTGPINDPSAPWNRFVPAELGSQFYSLDRAWMYGMPIVPGMTPVYAPGGPLYPSVAVTASAAK